MSTEVSQSVSNNAPSAISGRNRLLIEEIDYNVLFRWFVGLGMDDPSVPHGLRRVSMSNLRRLLQSTLAVWAQASGRGLSRRSDPTTNQVGQPQWLAQQLTYPASGDAALSASGRVAKANLREHRAVLRWVPRCAEPLRG